MFIKPCACHTQAKGWSVQFDIDEGVQYAAYIAHHIGIPASHAFPEANAVYCAWHTWWEQLLPQTLQQVTVAVERSMPQERSQSQLQEIARRIGTVYDPPHFARRASTPALQALCQEQWPLFQQWWGGTHGENARLTALMNTHIQALALPRLVRSCTRSANKQRTPPFQLTVEFVYWPSDYYRQVSPTFLVLGSQYLQTTHRNLLKERLSSAISDLL